MTHKNRSRHNANKRRWLAATAKQKPLPMDEQKRREVANAESHRKRYPVPPNYRPAHNARQPDQPLCYVLGRIIP